MDNARAFIIIDDAAAVTGRNRFSRRLKRTARKETHIGFGRSPPHDKIEFRLRACYRRDRP